MSPLENKAECGEGSSGSSGAMEEELMGPAGTESEAEELLAKGTRALAEGEAAEAAKDLTRACEILVGIHGTTAPQCYQVHFEYGRALLELGRLEPQVLSTAMTGIDQDVLLDEDEDKPDEPTEDAEEAADAKEKPFVEADPAAESQEKVHQMVEDAFAENAAQLEDKAAKPAADEAAKAEETKADETKAEETEKADEPVKENEAKPAEDPQEAMTQEEVDEEGDEEMEGEEGPEGDEDEEPTNLQLAWETLEVARMIAEGQEGKDWRLREMDVREVLGEVQIDDEKYEGALADLEAVLKLQTELLEAEDRRVAETHFQMARAHNLSNDFDAAATAYNKALAVINSRLEKLKTAEVETGKEAEREKEVGELTELVPEIQAKVEDALGSAASLAEKMAAVREELGLPAKAQTSVGFDAPKDAQPATSISHLVRKPLKRTQTPDDPATTGETVTKKPNTNPSPQKKPSLPTN